MPRVYPLEVRLFAVKKKKLGHSWDRVAELIREEFKIEPPNRRQMGVWLKNLSLTEGVERALVEDAGKKAEIAKAQALTRVVDGLIPTLLAARDYSGEEFEYSGWRWFFQAVEEVLGRDKFERFTSRYFKEPKAEVQPPTEAHPPEERESKEKEEATDEG